MSIEYEIVPETVNEVLLLRRIDILKRQLLTGIDPIGLTPANPLPIDGKRNTIELSLAGSVQAEVEPERCGAIHCYAQSEMPGENIFSGYYVDPLLIHTYNKRQMANHLAAMHRVMVESMATLIADQKQ